MSDNSSHISNGFIIESQFGEVWGCKISILSIELAGEMNYSINGTDTQFTQESCKQQYNASVSEASFITTGGSL
jgi:hypothetical protein